ncbi:MAG: PAS domain S-box protein [Anaerolineales bacterium]|nr:PAS domain S-box protein [Anaerolineales bacterium]
MDETLYAFLKVADSHHLLDRPFIRGGTTPSTVPHFTSFVSLSWQQMIAHPLFTALRRFFSRLIPDHGDIRRQRTSEARFRALLASAPVGIVIVDRAGRLVMVNQKIVDMFGYAPAALVGEALEMLLPPRLRTQHDAHRTGYFANPRARAMGVGLDLIGRRQDGSEFPIEVGLSYIETVDGQLAIGFVNDISERKQAEARLRQLNQELEQRVLERTAHLTAVNKELEAFSYSVSHDLRAPLRAISGFSQALLEDYGDRLDAEGQEFLDLIHIESERMSQLIDGLIDLSRYSRNPLIREPVNLSQMSRQIARDLQTQAPQRQVDFHIPEDIVAHGDAKLLRVVLRNLLENAWKYTAKQPRAEIIFGTTNAADGAADGAVYFVRDNGVGFNMAYVHKLFVPFQRLHSPVDFAGTGIGLATVQRIVRRHGGNIYAEGAPNQGATFYFTLGSGGRHKHDTA